MRVTIAKPISLAFFTVLGGLLGFTLHNRFIESLASTHATWFVAGPPSQMFVDQLRTTIAFGILGAAVSIGISFFRTHITSAKACTVATLLVVAVAVAATWDAQAVILARLAATMAGPAPLNIPLLLPLPHVPVFWIAVTATVCVAVDVGITMRYLRRRRCWR
ncbi:hypothetical protein [Burkholderia ambifaria]|uniref:hypothetical protein n=1 Tax=Burkholderia ambifaria TaxID=152480 RepID=UPI00158BC6E4|nr:hypothetical protein [Burkholderia ambifaria]